MTKADWKKLAQAMYKADKMQRSEDGKRAVFQATSYIAQEFDNLDFIGQVADLILEVKEPDNG